MKHCNSCKKEVAESLFYIRSPRCIPCDKRLTKASRNKHRLRRSDVLTARRLGATFEAVTTVRRKQDGRCAACNKPSGDKRHHMDHDHSSGKLRGMLCFRCNAALGQVDDSIETLQSLIIYLAAHQNAEVSPWTRD